MPQNKNKKLTVSANDTKKFHPSQLKLPHCSRRQFILSSLCSLVACSSHGVFSPATAAAANVNLLQKPGFTIQPFPYKPYYAMVVIQKECIGCGKCVEACNKTNSITNDGYRLAILNKNSLLTGKQAEGNFLPVLCNQCNNPPCVKVCPTKATFKDATTGIVMTDDTLCIGCKTCMTACPYNARYYDPKRQAIDKCDFCFKERLSINNDSLPACVEACPKNAFIFGDLSDKESRIAHFIEQNKLNLLVLRPQKDTVPNVFYLSE